MNLSDAISTVRGRLDDTEPDYLWSDAELIAHFNEAEKEAAIRALLIDDEFDIPIVTTEKRYTLPANIVQIGGAHLASKEDIPFTGYVTTETRLILSQYPSADDTLVLSGYRLPAAAMVDMDDVPEINAMHHINLLDWVMFRAYSKHDSDGYNIDLARYHEAEFIKNFGTRNTANQLRKQRGNGSKSVQFNDFN